MNPGRNWSSEGLEDPLIFCAALDDNLRHPMWLPSVKVDSAVHPFYALCRFGGASLLCFMSL
jgi:hypothetical protein